MRLADVWERIRLRLQEGKLGLVGIVIDSHTFPRTARIFSSSCPRQCREGERSSLISVLTMFTVHSYVSGDTPTLIGTIGCR